MRSGMVVANPYPTEFQLTHDVKVLMIDGSC